jgi:hypothetical protein
MVACRLTRGAIPWRDEPPAPDASAFGFSVAFLVDVVS